MQGVPPASHNTVVTYYPHGASMRQAGIVFFSIAFLFLIHLGGRAFSETFLRCDRGVGLCYIEQHYPVGKTTSASIPIASIKGVREESNHSQRGRRYLVILGTSSGDDVLATYVSQAEASERAEAANVFFESQIDSTMDVKCDSPSPFFGLAFFLGAAFVLVFGFRFTIYARVEAIWDKHILRTTLLQWPFKSVLEDIPIDTIEDVVVVQGVAQSGSFYGVSLIVADRGDVPLVPQKSPSVQTAQRAVDEIHALLRIRDGGGLRSQYHV